MNQKTRLTSSAILLNRGRSEFELGRYHEALEDFKQMTDSDLEHHKYNNMGACFFQMGLYEEANKHYVQAIKSNSALKEAYFNLGVLYCNENKIDKAKKMFETCLAINKNFKEARQTLRELQKVGIHDWYEWWFRRGKFKHFLGGVLFSLVLIFAIGIALISLKEGTTLNIVGLALSLGVFFALLILPSIESLKIAGIELKRVIPSSTGANFPLLTKSVTSG